jgi:predicted hydrolase (HD superfamily)
MRYRTGKAVQNTMAKALNLTDAATDELIGRVVAPALVVPDVVVVVLMIQSPEHY